MDTDELPHDTKTMILKVEEITSASEPTAAPETTGVMDLMMRQLTEETPSTPEHLIAPKLEEESRGTTRHLNMRHVKVKTLDNSDHLIMDESQEESPHNADTLAMPYVKEDTLDEHVTSADSDEDMADEQTPDENTQDEQTSDEHTPDEHTPDEHTPEAGLTLKDGHGEDDGDEEHGHEEGGEDSDGEDEEESEDDDEHDNAAHDEDYSVDDGEDADEATEDEDEDEEDEDEDEDEEAKPAAPKKHTSVQVVIPPKHVGNYYLSESQIASAKIHSSLASHNESAKLHSKSSTYTIQHRLSSKKPFSMIAYTLTSGPYAGRVAWVADPDIRAKFRFLELAPEVRNMIYDLLFVRKDSKVTFSSTKESNQGNGSAGDLVGTWMWIKNAPNKNRKDWYIKGLGLLATCKEIREEAASVVYGSNAFDFAKTTDLISFLAVIGGRNRMLVRSISTGWIIPKDARAAARLLLDCKQLETLHLDLSYMTVHPYNSLKTPEKVVPLFKPVLKQMFAYLYGKHVQIDIKNKEKTFNFFTKGRVNWTLLGGPPSRDTVADKATRREYNKQMKKSILEATNAKRVIAAHQALVKKEMAAAARKAAATEKKRSAAQKKLAPKQKTVVKRPATSAAAPTQPAVGNRVTRSQTLTILRREVD